MERNTIIAGAAAGLAAVALVVAGATSSAVSNATSSVNFDPTIHVATAENPEVDSTESAEEAAESGTESAVEGTTEAAVADTESAEEDADGETEVAPISASKAQFNIVLGSDGAIKIRDTTIRVPAPTSDDTTVTAHDLYVTLPGENTIRYDSQSNYLTLNDNTLIRVINASDVTYENICNFEGPEGETILIGEKKIDDDSAIAVVHTIPASEDDSTAVDMEAETQVVADILAETTSSATVASASLFGYPINPDWVADAVITDQGVALIKGDSKIYVAPYDGDFTEGTDNTLKAGGITLNYSQSLKSSDDYTPYLLPFDAAQDGTIPEDDETGTDTAKILAQSNLMVKDLFSAQ